MAILPSSHSTQHWFDAEMDPCKEVVKDGDGGAQKPEFFKVLMHGFEKELVHVSPPCEKKKLSPFK